jgi:Skp family chaperone for outer membrane proteins
MLALSGMTAFGQNRVATIDLHKVFDNYWKRQTAEASLKEHAADMDKQNKELVDNWESLRSDYEKLEASASDPAVSADERAKRKNAADAKLLEIKEAEQTIDSFRRQAAATLDEQKRRMRDKILDEIKAVVSARAKTSGYTMVVDSAAESANGTPVYLYNNGENDITDDILKQLNSTAPVPDGNTPAPSTN